MFRMKLLINACLLLQASRVLANTEKTIFLGPANLQNPVEHPTLEDLQLEALSPQDWSVRTHIRAEFPTSSSKFGQASWYLLNGLEEGQRYEVRVCWAATQPTSFRLETYKLPTVFETPELIKSLAEYSQTRQPFEGEPKSKVSREDSSQHSSNRSSSSLFLRVFAAADFYTMNKTLMDHPPLVNVDVILDPFIYNVFPRSLVPTAAYIILLAIGSWYASSYIGNWIANVSQLDTSTEKKKS